MAGKKDSSQITLLQGSTRGKDQDKPPFIVEAVLPVWDVVPKDFNGRKGKLLRVSRCNDDEFKLVIEYG